MATQGLLSIVNENDKVIFKVITGSDGYYIPDLKEWFIKNTNATAQQVFEAARRIIHGGKDNDSLVVQYGPNSFLTTNEEDLQKLYVDKFPEPEFNPRWEYGSADYVEVVHI